MTAEPRRVANIASGAMTASQDSDDFVFSGGVMQVGIIWTLGASTGLTVTLFKWVIDDATTGTGNWLQVTDTGGTNITVISTGAASISAVKHLHAGAGAAVTPFAPGRYKFTLAAAGTVSTSVLKLYVN